MPGIIGKKLGMSQVIQDDGRVIPATFVKCDPNEVVQVKVLKSAENPESILSELANACTAVLWRKIGKVGILFLK